MEVKKCPKELEGVWIFGHEWRCTSFSAGSSNSNPCRLNRLWPSFDCYSPSFNDIGVYLHVLCMWKVGGSFYIIFEALECVFSSHSWCTGLTTRVYWCRFLPPCNDIASILPIIGDTSDLMLIWDSRMVLVDGIYYCRAWNSSTAGIPPRRPQHRHFDPFQANKHRCIVYTWHIFTMSVLLAIDFSSKWSLGVEFVEVIHCIQRQELKKCGVLQSHLWNEAGVWEPLFDNL